MIKNIYNTLEERNIILKKHNRSGFNVFLNVLMPMWDITPVRQPKIIYIWVWLTISLSGDIDWNICCQKFAAKIL